jgi:hypothetical protein
MPSTYGVILLFRLVREHGLGKFWVLPSELAGSGTSEQEV